MGFVFRLEKVARHRQRLVDAQARRVAAAQRVVSDLQVRLQAIEQDLDRQLHSGGDGSARAVNVADLMARTNWVAHLEDRRLATARELADADGEVDRCRAELQDAWRDREVLEKLRQRQKAIWQAAEAKRANLQMDEIGQIRADRQRRTKVAT